MINERDITRRFTGIWRQAFPLLTPSFIRVFNETQMNKTRLIDIKTTIVHYEELLGQDNSQNEQIKYDLVSETAFNLAEVLHNNNRDVEEEHIKNEINEIVADTAKSIWLSGNYTVQDLDFTEHEYEIISSFTQNTLNFIKDLKGEKVSFRPKLKGYGFIPDLTADLSIDDTLFEVKTVKRNFNSSDLKQLLLYLALNHVSNSSKWQYAGLFNPRRGVYCKFNVRELVYKLSSGKSPVESFEDLLNSLVRDIEIDSRF